MATYRQAGVDLAAADAVVDRIGDAVTATWGDAVVGGFGGFAAGLRLPAGYRHPVLMMATDGVGTKAEIARLAGRVEGLGWDLVAMCVDDLAAAGARPVAMTDYLAVGSIDVEVVATLVGSIAAACAAAGVALLGGETAEHPGVMQADRFDLAGTALGVVEDGEQIDGSDIAPGDVIVGVASPTLRSNGFSLVRRVVLDRLALDDPMPGGEGTVADTLLAPSVIYAPAIVDLVAAHRPTGLAHITGGGLAGNIVRVLPGGCQAIVDTGCWEPPAVFASVADLGDVPGDEMFAVFNMGIGFVVITPSHRAQASIGALAASGHEATVIGAVVAGERTVRLV
ncbi:MAG: phosphoribosylformylglycinamidine cyclo-ligase [Actinomycetota bacterium]|nr:phosphoribosylformylglycinamidine cyclo-ligase [Actinomycetota bacterium]